VRQQLTSVFARPFLFLGLFNRCPLFLLPVEAKIDNNKTEKTIECFFIFIFLSVTYSAYFKLTIPSKPQRAKQKQLLLYIAFPIHFILFSWKRQDAKGKEVM